MSQPSTLVQSLVAGVTSDLFKVWAHKLLLKGPSKDHQFLRVNNNSSHLRAILDKFNNSIMGPHNKIIDNYPRSTVFSRLLTTKACKREIPTKSRKATRCLGRGTRVWALLTKLSQLPCQTPGR
jgi:hypothetical protein